MAPAPATPADVVPSSGRIPSLDGWRAIAILLVLIDHATLTSGFPKSILGHYALFVDGNLGVRIFFVLSGFLISLLLLKETDRTGGVSLRHFYLRRIFRIFPVYFAYLGVLAALTLAGLYADSAASWIGCLTFTRNVVGSIRSGTSHFWSLAVEEQFYILWPILLGRLQLWKRSIPYVGILLLPIVICPVIRGCFSPDTLGGTFANKILGYRSILVYADSLAIGCLGAWMFWKSAPIASWRTFHTALLLACLAVLLEGHLLQLASASRTLKAIVPAAEGWAVLGCIWLGTHERSPGFGILNSKPMVTLGVLSYSIYVWHFLFVSFHMGPQFARWPTHDWKFWVIPTVAVSAVSYYFLEVPFMNLRRRFQN